MAEGNESLAELRRWLDTRRRSIRLANLLIEAENDQRFSAHSLRPGEKRIEPAVGDRRVDAIGTQDVRSWFDGIAATHPASASRVLAAIWSFRPRSPPVSPRRRCRQSTTGCG